MYFEIAILINVPGHYLREYGIPFPQNPIEPERSPVGPSSNPGADSEDTLMPK